MKVLLCIPPDYAHHFPPLATPAILGFLKSKRIDTAQIDLNMAYREFLLNKISDNNILLAEKKVLLDFLLTKFFKDRLKRRYYSQCLPSLSNKKFGDIPYGNNTNSSFYFTENLLASKYLFRYLTDEKENSFLECYRKQGIIARLKKDNVNILGISVTSPSQAIPALTLGLLVKREIPDIHVNMGGQWVTLFRNELIKRKDLFACFDSLIVFEGETPFYELAKALRAGITPEGINIITRNNLNSRFNHRGEDLNTLACPDFSGLPLKYYDACRKGPVLTYEASRGCYWSKCAYCVDLPLPKPAYRAKHADIVVREIKELIKKFKVVKVVMGDPGMPPRQMLAISKELIRQKVKIKWWTMARLDPGFNRKIFETAAKSGLVQINFGFESANDRVCDFLQKGNRREVSAQVIKDCAAAGIEVNLQTMIGLPGETHDDAMDTVSFLIENKQYITDVTFNVYYLTSGNHVYRNPGHYGIRFNKSKVLPFQFFIPFVNIRGMTKKGAADIIKVYQKLLDLGGKQNKLDEGKMGRLERRGNAVLSLCGQKISVKFEKYTSGNMVAQ